MTFEIELLAFDNWKDVSDAKDGSVVKQIIDKSTDFKTPSELSTGKEVARGPVPINAGTHKELSFSNQSLTLTRSA